MNKITNSDIQSQIYLTIKQKLSVNKYKKYLFILKQMCIYSKQLYNESLLYINNYYKQFNQYIQYNNLQKRMQNNSINYKILNAQVACNTIELLDNNFKSFFKLKQMNYKGNIPKYIQNNYFLCMTNKIHIQNNYWYIPLSKQFMKQYNIKNNRYRPKIKIPKILRNKKIEFIKIVPKNNGNYFEIQYSYLKDIRIQKKQEKNYLSIDLGINNLATCVAYKHNTKDIFKSFIIDGKNLKSINQFCNKQLKYYQKRNTNKNLVFTKRMHRIIQKRNDQVNYYIHKTSKYIINYCKKNYIDTIILGWNGSLYKCPKLGRKNNQHFMYIPLGKLKDNLIYRCKKDNIKIIMQEESYTSKANFMNNDYMPKYENKKILTLTNKIELRKIKFSGRREYRGLYNTNIKTQSLKALAKARKNKIMKINADMNGSLNILRKYLLHKRKNKVEDLTILYMSNEIQKLYKDIKRVIDYRGALMAPIRLRIT